MNITIEAERPISWNQLYSGGMHWSERKVEADRVHAMVRIACLNTRARKIFENPVDLTFTAYFKNRPLDASNICAKLYEDGLKGLLIKDDTPEYVRSVKTVSLIDKENPRLVITIEEVTDVD